MTEYQVSPPHSTTVALQEAANAEFDRLNEWLMAREIEAIKKRGEILLELASSELPIRQMPEMPPEPPPGWHTIDVWFGQCLQHGHAYFHDFGKVVCEVADKTIPVPGIRIGILVKMTIAEKTWCPYGGKEGHFIQ